MDGNEGIGCTRREFVGRTALVLAAGALASAVPRAARVASAEQGNVIPIEFMSKGVRCRGLKYIPDDLRAGGRRPAIVMAHGFSAVKEMYFTNYAEEFRRAGLVAVLFDYRYLGESGGEPRGQVLPFEQIEDYRNAITFAQTQPEVDPEKIGVFGSSYSGGHVIVVGAVDRRVKCVASQVPYLDGWATADALNTKTGIDGFVKFLEGDRSERYKSGRVNYLPVVAADGNAVLNTQTSYQWFTETAKKMAPRWENRVTVESLEWLFLYHPVLFVPKVSPTPLLIVVAENDELVPTEVTLRAYNGALEPKKIVIVPGGHFDAYVKGFPVSSRAATAWFTQWLKG